MPVLVFENDLRMQVALVLHDQVPHVAAGVFFGVHRFAFDEILVADLAGNFGEDRDAVRIPLAKDRAGGRVLVLFDEEVGAGGHLVFLQFAALGIQEQNFAVAGEHDVLALVVADDFHAGELHDAAFLGLDFALFDGVGRGSADVEGPHRKLRARLADALRADDAHRHPLLDEAAGREVHAVAQLADAQRGVASQRAADLDFFQAHRLDAARDFGRNQIVFADDHFVGDRIDDVRPAHAAADRIDEADFDLFAAVNNALRNALRGAAIVLGDDHVLGHIGQFASQVTRVGRFQRRIGQALAGAVRRTEVLEYA